MVWCGVCGSAQEGSWENRGEAGRRKRPKRKGSFLIFEDRQRGEELGVCGGVEEWRSGEAIDGEAWFFF